MAHFKLKATIDGQESIQEEFTNLTGNKTLKIFPGEQNTSQQTLRGVATVNLSNKTYNIYLTHKGQSSEDPDPSVAKWSYIDPLYSTRDVLVPDETKLSLDTAYVRASCGKSYYDEDEEGYITNIILSKRYDTYQDLLNTVGDFSGNHYGTISDSTSARVLVSFKMFYKAIGDSGVIPVDDGSPESNKARIPAKPEASAAPDWITSGYIRYVVNSISDGIKSTRIFVNWDSFIGYWENLIVDPTCDDATFSYEYVGVIQPNNSTKARDNQTITFNEIDNGKTPGRHGLKPLYLKISQQEGFVRYRLSSTDAPSSCFLLSKDDPWLGRWSLLGWDDSSSVYTDPILNLENIVNQALPEDTNSTYGHHCIFSPEFKVYSGTTDPRGVPAKVWTEKGYTLMGDSTWNTISYQYIGKPIVMSTFRETPSTFEKTQLIPYVRNKIIDYSGGHGDFEPSEGQLIEVGINDHSLLGEQCFDLFASNLDNPYEIMYRDSIQDYHSSGPMDPRILSGIIGNNKKWILKLIPVSILTPSNSIHLSYLGVGNNEVNRFREGKSAVTSQELVRRAVYAEYRNDIKIYPEYNSPMTINGRVFETEYSDDDSAYWKNVSQILFIPVLFTDFYLEQENPFESISNGILGRLFFSIRELGATTDASDLTQLVIKIPKITRI